MKKPKNPFWKINYKKLRHEEKIAFVCLLLWIGFLFVSGITYAANPTFRQLVNDQWNGPVATEEKKTETTEVDNSSGSIIPAKCPSGQMAVTKDGQKISSGYRNKADDKCVPEISSSQTGFVQVQSGCPTDYYNKMVAAYKNYDSGIYGIWKKAVDESGSPDIAWNYYNDSSTKAYNEMVADFKKAGCKSIPPKITQSRFTSGTSTPTVPVAPPPVVCSSSTRTSIINSYNNAVSDENSRYDNEVYAINAEYARRGISRSGMHLNALAASEASHNSNLNNLLYQYNQQLLNSNCSSM